MDHKNKYIKQKDNLNLIPLFSTATAGDLVLFLYSFFIGVSFFLATSITGTDSKPQQNQ